MPKLPNIDAANIEDAKLLGYLLDAGHERGAAKAQFLARFGFTPADHHALRDALIAHAVANDATATRQSEHGTGFEIDGPLRAPDGRAPDGTSDMVHSER